MLETLKPFILHASRRGTADGPIRWIIINTGSGPDAKLLCPCWIGGSPEPAVVVKFARHPAGNPRIRAEYEALTHLQSYTIPPENTVPYPLGITEVGGRIVTLESALPGKPLRTYLHEQTANADAAGISGAVMRWLTTLATRSARPSRADDIHRLILEPLAAAPGELDLSQAEQEGLGRLGGLVRRLLAAGELPVVFTHNDLGTPNIMVDRGDFSGVLDWESGGPGLLATDLVYFLDRLAYETLSARGKDHLKGYRHTFFEPAATPEAHPAKEWLFDYCEQLGISPEWLPVLFGLSWVMHARNEKRQHRQRRQRSGFQPQGVSPGVPDTHFRDHLSFYLQNMDRFAEAMSLDLLPPGGA
ncbi:MAG TPA: aminoglycoside phosphotransferase family protein [Chloroflexia bacterium]|nr:aminoglycoside phosphotransferase family protein [Chloroflexia bacterium]